MDNIKFLRGTTEAIKGSSAVNGTIAFSTDESKIFMKMNGDWLEYGGNNFNIDSVRVVKEVELLADKRSIRITYTGEESPLEKTITLEASSGIYNSKLDGSVATVTALGGIAAGTTVSALNGKSYDEMFDELIFPTVRPTITAPSASIALKSGYLASQEIGADAPQVSNFTTGFNQGSIKIGTQEQAKRAGALDADNSKILFGSSKSETLPSKIVSGANDYYYRAAYAAGPQPLDSKGNPDGTPLAAGYVDSSKVTINGYRPAYYGLVSTNNITEDVIKSLTKKVSAKSTVKVSGPITEQYICFAAPAGWTVANIKDSNNFDVTGTYAKSTVSVTCLDGTAVNYTVYLSAITSQPSTYYVNFN